jgi:hypothetical protein
MFPATAFPATAFPATMSPELLSDASFKKREDWESFRIGVDVPENPGFVRNARHPSGPYFPVELERPESTIRCLLNESQFRPKSIKTNVNSD